MKPVPKWTLNGECTPSIQVYSMSPRMQLVFSNEATDLRTYNQSDAAIMIDTGGVELRGDVLIRVYNEGFIPLITDKLLLRIGFHTSFVSDYFMDLPKKELDSGVSGSLHDERFPDDFCVRLMFSS